ncbi:oxygen-insensitive NADPH nitroreductase [Paenibacillus sp. YPG26]|uniref:oxygen-insensitive NADPH nitroreductase n=1 Tax=Paenibacillus sp. YPG26 TaxID=2878915 RepID=UPI00203D1AED|nr:oxygen-insensitive NADPH nitroreductase [Paenibacillus sp. YPG26]USB33701.1 oxygen-insensitive NADPH nitroreductase [Paenibacillus sp. YPG26]
MNDTIALLKSHRSIRKFKDKPLGKSMVEQIISAGQAASTSSNVQAFSVVAITDTERKGILSELAGNQAYIRECPVFLVWCADLHRLKYTAEKHRPGQESYEDVTESFIIATVDTALAAQNAAVAAESLGLGIVYIGAIRNRIDEVADLLELPDLVYPVFGMCLGYPDQEPGLRPRLPVSAVLHWDEYDTDKTEDQVELYDKTMSGYLRERTGGQKDTPWSELMAEKLTQPARLHMREFLQKRGFELK